MLGAFGDVTCVDAAQGDYQGIAGKKFDVMVGMSPPFAELQRLCRVRKSVWIACGLHPRERNRMLRDVVERNQWSQALYGPLDFVPPEAAEQQIRAADYVLIWGNNAVYNSYVRHGVPKWKLKTMHGEAFLDDARDRGEAVAGGSESRPRIFTFAAPDIGLRQGFETVVRLFTNPDVSVRNFRLHVVGDPSTPYFAERIRQLQNCLGYKMSYRGWNGTDDVHYGNIMTSSDFVILPALDGEEAPALLDAIRRGTIPLVSSYAGIDYSPLGKIEPWSGGDAGSPALSQAMQITMEDVAALKQKSLDYYEEYHASGAGLLQQTLKDCMSGRLYPKVSVTLPIFNKEKTIVSLLTYLDQALGEYPDAELHVLLDGCTDKSEYEVKRFFTERSVNYSVTYEKTPNIFEVKTNNIGLKKSSGTYCVILQDDNYIYDRSLIFEAVNFMEKNPSCTVLGCLSGVNFYPRGTVMSVPGQTACNDNEVYWRQDAQAEPELRNRIFEVDACMRGPLFVRKSFLVQHGYLDEVYAPLYQDDMDLCFRARYYGGKVYCLLADVENRSLTMAHYDAEKNRFFTEVMKRNTDIFYARWAPGIRKSDFWIHRIPIQEGERSR
jgi:glycosyltransferase involved in cell wall biosynthesis